MGKIGFFALFQKAAKQPPNAFSANFHVKFMTVHHKGNIIANLKWAVTIQIITSNLAASVFFRPKLWSLNESLELYLRLKF